MKIKIEFLINDVYELIDIENNYKSMRGCSIPEVELRGISIKQLKAVYAEIEARCEVGRMEII